MNDPDAFWTRHFDITVAAGDREDPAAPDFSVTFTPRDSRSDPAAMPPVDVRVGVHGGQAVADRTSVYGQPNWPGVTVPELTRAARRQVNLVLAAGG